MDKTLEVPLFLFKQFANKNACIIYADILKTYRFDSKLSMQYSYTRAENLYNMNRWTIRRAMRILEKAEKIKRGYESEMKGGKLIPNQLSITLLDGAIQDSNRF